MIRRPPRSPLFPSTPLFRFWPSRIADQKKAVRLKYISVFKTQGALAGEECPHANSQVTAPIFVPRRIKYELSSSHEWFKDKERCIFCDMVRQEEKQGKRIVDVQGDYYALCPYASRVPYEIWLLHRRHNHTFEQPRPGSNRRQLAALLGRILRRLENSSERSEEHTSELQSQSNLVCRLLLEKKKKAV